MIMLLQVTFSYMESVFLFDKDSHLYSYDRFLFIHFVPKLNDFLSLGYTDTLCEVVTPGLTSAFVLH